MDSHTYVHEDEGSKRATPHSLVAVPRGEMEGLVGAERRSLVFISHCFTWCTVSRGLWLHTQ